MLIAGSTVVVTGGSSGLGAAVVELMLAGGARVAVFDRAPPGPVAAEGDCLLIALDVCSEQEVQRGLEQVVAAFGAPSICVNCAGILDAGLTVGRQGPHDQGRFERVLDVNLAGSFNVIRQVAALMAASPPRGEDGERGVIVNTASIAGLEGQRGQVAYAASKAGVIGMTLPLARDLAPFGIRVNTVCPGVFDTRMMAGAGEAQMAALLQSVPFPRRLGRPDEFARLVAHICENGFLNGAVIRLDGGARLPAA